MLSTVGQTVAFRSHGAWVLYVTDGQADSARGKVIQITFLYRVKNVPDLP